MNEPWYVEFFRGDHDHDFDHDRHFGRDHDRELQIEIVC